MTKNFFYYAYSYLDEWLDKDRRFHQVLAFGECGTTPKVKGTECLVEVAKYYKVIRTLKKTGEHSRLSDAYDLLQAVEAPTVGDVVAKVEGLARDLRGRYGVTALSAASKFLWMRFQSPVIIYDSIVSGWLCKNCGYKDSGYADYCRLWSSKYREHEAQIQEACAELKNIKKFTRAYHVSDEQLSEWTSSRWFTERVFDHSMLYTMSPW